MKVARVTARGQLSIPAAIRRRWGTSRVVLEDEGDRLVVTPLAEDPVAGVRGVFKRHTGPTAALREAARRDDEAATARRS